MKKSGMKILPLFLVLFGLASCSLNGGISGESSSSNSNNPVVSSSDNISPSTKNSSSSSSSKTSSNQDTSGSNDNTQGSGTGETQGGSTDGTQGGGTEGTQGGSNDGTQGGATDGESEDDESPVASAIKNTLESTNYTFTLSKISDDNVLNLLSDDTTLSVLYDTDNFIFKNTNSYGDQLSYVIHDDESKIVYMTDGVGNNVVKVAGDSLYKIKTTDGAVRFINGIEVLTYSFSYKYITLFKPLDGDFVYNEVDDVYQTIINKFSVSQGKYLSGNFVYSVKIENSLIKEIRIKGFDPNVSSVEYKISFFDYENTDVTIPSNIQKPTSFEYIVDTDGKILIKGIHPFVNKFSTVIPDEIDGKHVKGFHSSFQSNYNIEVYVPYFTDDEYNAINIVKFELAQNLSSRTIFNGTVIHRSLDEESCIYKDGELYYVIPEKIKPDDYKDINPILIGSDYVFESFEFPERIDFSFDGAYYININYFPQFLWFTKELVLADYLKNVERLIEIIPYFGLYLNYNSYEDGYYVGSKDNPYYAFIDSIDMKYSLTVHEDTLYFFPGYINNMHTLVEIYALNGFKKMILDDRIPNNKLLFVHNDIEEESVIVEDGDFVFAYDENVGAYLIDYVGNNTEVTLSVSFTYGENTINKYKINSYAFENKKQIEKIYVTDSAVEEILDNAFSGTNAQIIHI